MIVEVKTIRWFLYFIQAFASSWKVYFLQVCRIFWSCCLGFERCWRWCLQGLPRLRKYQHALESYKVHRRNLGPSPVGFKITPLGVKKSVSNCTEMLCEHPSWEEIQKSLEVGCSHYHLCTCLFQSQLLLQTWRDSGQVLHLLALGSVLCPANFSCSVFVALMAQNWVLVGCADLECTCIFLL